ncbi:MAG: mannitol dehydrogenase family protein [Pseudomonadota bacterium]
MTTRPRLSRKHPAPRAGIVHLGLGAFFRSHGALVIEDAIRAAVGDWGITGASLRSPGIRDRLAAQDFAYTAVEMGPEGERTRIVEVLRDVIFAAEGSNALVTRMAEPLTRIVSLTVTEKGYCHVPSTGALDSDHLDIRHDIANAQPRSAVGYIVRALQKRHQRGLRPFTVLSCDNLPDNGRVTRSVVTGLAARIDPSLAAWIDSEARFPSTMVDRIVPATTEANIARLADATGYLDQAPAFHEPFLQWVIEDSFVDGLRPAFEQIAGVQMVRDVAPFEHMKIRMLNGTHSTLAYLGYLAGHETIAETVADPGFRAFIEKVWKTEIIPTLRPPEGVDLQRYADDLLQRYSNPAIHHRTWQIAMDGSQKLPQRILGTISDNRASGKPSDGLCLAVAGWMRYVGGKDESGEPIDVRDPLSDRLRDLSDKADSPGGKVSALLSVREVFGNGVDPATADTITQAYEHLTERGAAACVQSLATDR